MSTGRRTGIGSAVGAIAALAAIALAVAFAIGAGEAGAHQQIRVTQIELAIADVTVEDDLFLTGVVHSARRCAARRRVRMVFVYGDGSRLISDRGTTSRTGAFTLLGAFDPEPELIVLRAAKKRLAPKTKRHRHLCGSARFTLPVN